MIGSGFRKQNLFSWHCSEKKSFQSTLHPHRWWGKVAWEASLPPNIWSRLHILTACLLHYLFVAPALCFVSSVLSSSVFLSFTLGQPSVMARRWLHPLAHVLWVLNLFWEKKSYCCASFFRGTTPYGGNTCLYFVFVSVFVFTCNVYCLVSVCIPLYVSLTFAVAIGASHLYFCL